MHRVGWCAGRWGQGRVAGPVYQCQRCLCHPNLELCSMNMMMMISAGAAHLLNEEVPAVLSGVQNACSLDRRPNIIAEALLLLLWRQAGRQQPHAHPSHTLLVPEQGNGLR